MNSIEASHAPDASGATPKQLDHIPNLRLSDGNEIPFVSPLPPIISPSLP